MFWKRPEFTDNDTKQIVQKALPKLQKQLGAPVYVTVDDQAIVTEDYVLKELLRLVIESDESVDVHSLASELGLPRKTVEPLLIHKVIPQSGLFFDGTKVLTPKRVASVGKHVCENNAVASLSEVCSSENLTIKAVEHIFRRGVPEVVLLGDFVAPESVLRSHEQNLKDELQSATTPVKYEEVEPDSRILPLLKKRLNIPPHELLYVPGTYTAAQTDAAAADLEDHGYVNLNDFPNIPIYKQLQQQFPDCKQLGHFVVSQKMISESQEKIDTNLKENNYYDTRELPLQPFIAQYLIMDEKNKYQKLQSKQKPAILVKPQLERSATGAIVESWKVKVNEQIDTMDFSKVTGADSAKSFVNKIVLPAASELQTDVAALSVPAELNLASQIAPAVRSALVDYTSKLITPRFEAALHRSEAKVRAYLNGCISLQAEDSSNNENSAFALAWDEFQQYVSDHQFTVPESVSVAKSQFSIDDDDDQLTLVVSELQQNTKTKLMKLAQSTKNSTRDSAPLLHLAVVLYHSEHFCNNKGFLKIRGKAVPKVTKMFNFPPSFSELRSNIKTADLSLLQKVKEDALN